MPSEEVYPENTENTFPKTSKIPDFCLNQGFVVQYCVIIAPLAQKARCNEVTDAVPEGAVNAEIPGMQN